jgi:transcriptional regulator with XRE-family HTH domain
MRTSLEIFGSRLRELREKRGMTQEQLADLTATNRSYLTLVELGRENIGLQKILAIAAALEVIPAELFAGFTTTTMRRLFRE